MLFMSAGTVDNFFWDKHRNTFTKALLGHSGTPVAFVLASFIIAITMPAMKTGMGDIFNYPLYNFTWSQSLYSLGGFFWIYFWCYIAELIMNDKFNEKWYRFYNGASMWGYVSHYLWIVFAAQLFVIKKIHYSDDPAVCKITGCDNCICNLLDI